MAFARHQNFIGWDSDTAGLVLQELCSLPQGLGKGGLAKATRL